MDEASAKERIAKLRTAVDRYRYEYHVLDKSTMSDAALDSLKKELFDLEQQFPHLITPDSPTQRVAGQPLEGFTKVHHPGRMVSLNDAFTEQDMTDWLERLESFLHEPYGGTFYCDIKMDGLAIELVYRDGLLEQASTRGDGMVGEDVTQNVKTVDAVPLRLRLPDQRAGDDEQAIPETLIVRGEVFLSKSEFARINRELAGGEEKTYANPRNLAAGTIRQLDPKIVAGRKLSFYAYSIVGNDGTYGGTFSTHDEECVALRTWGIATNPHGRTARTMKEVFAFYREWEAKREALDYEFDGTVISVNDNKVYRRGGIVGKSPRGAIAFKFSQREAQTVVEDIIVQVGRTGVLTPVAVLRPVAIGGTTVSRATLHNLDEVRRLGVRVGDTVIVGRAGDVIPDVRMVLVDLRTGKEKEFHMPKKCPVCGQPVQKIAEQVAYRCVNKNCPAIRREALYHFVSRKAFNIDGVGPRIIDQLMDTGLVRNASDFFFLTKEDLLNLERFADTSAENAMTAIQSRKKIPFAKFIYALGIEHVGEETAVALARHFKTLADVRRASQEELQGIPDVGPVVAQSIYEWFKQPYNKKMLDRFSKAGVHIVYEEMAASRALFGKKFVLTGTLETMSREEASEKIRSFGGDVSSSVSKETDYVVAGANPGSKYDKAQKLGVAILDETSFKKLLSQSVP
jgi:DNA ligase (NAD+)